MAANYTSPNKARCSEISKQIEKQTKDFISKGGVVENLPPPKEGQFGSKASAWTGLKDGGF